MEFQLFRIKVYPSEQGILFEKQLSRPEILKQTIMTLPSLDLKSGMFWHIGNIIKIDNNGIYFRIGRTTKSTIERFNNGNFTDEEFEIAPYTHAFIDFNIEICAIAKKNRLSPTTSGIANQFLKLLNNSEKAKSLSATFEIGDLKDPEDFISHLSRAHSIRKFWISFTKPNAFDVNNDFIKPSQKLIEVSKSNFGKTQIEGDNIDPNILEELARSAASTGDDAAAWLNYEQNDKIIKKQLKGNPVNVTEENIDTDDHKSRFLNRIRSLYLKIRGKTKDNV